MKMRGDLPAWDESLRRGEGVIETEEDVDQEQQGRAEKQNPNVIPYARVFNRL